MTRAIYFDMDGTIADLYAVEGWLEALRAEYTKPYREAKSLLNMRALGRELNRLQEAGYVIGIVSWASKEATEDYLARIEKAKIAWLMNHLGAVNFDEIHIVEYGTPKSTVVEFPNGILFYDEEKNRKEYSIIERYIEKKTLYSRKELLPDGNLSISQKREKRIFSFWGIR